MLLMRLTLRWVVTSLIVIALPSASAETQEENDSPTAASAADGRHDRRLRTLQVEDVYSDAAASSLQPHVTVVEGLPARHGLASLSDPNGTIWCNGAPTYWITGHQSGIESPLCLVDGNWTLSPTVTLNPKPSDRHFCVSMDVNKDGRPDIICNVGAGRGHSAGYTELYLTQENGTLLQVPDGHGLQTDIYMRNRVAATLRNGNGVAEYVFFGTKGEPRDDGMPNVHRMYRNTPDGTFPYFTPIHGPWEYLFQATCAVAGDFTGNGRDDMVVCNEDGPPLLVRQLANNTFKKVSIPSYSYMKYWRQVRIADVTQDGRGDLIVVIWGQPSKLYVFRGITKAPFFDFKNIYYQTALPWASPNLEVLDVNQDKRKDIYVVQADETPQKYFCGAVGRVVKIPDDQVPPLDTAHDYLLVGNGAQSRFTKLQMVHSKPGCGWIAQRWDDTTMLLGQGSFDYPGFGLLLQWK